MIVTRAAIIAMIACATGAQAAECPHAGTLGTSRTLAVDAAHTPRVNDLHELREVVARLMRHV